MRTEPREFYVGDTTIATLTIPGAPNLLSSIVQVQARRETDNAIVSVLAYDLAADGTCKFDLTDFCAAVVSPSGRDEWDNLSAIVSTGANQDTYRIWPPTGEFRVVQLP